MENRLIIFTDSGDTIIDEGTQVRDERGIVVHAELIPGAGETLQALYSAGYRIALVADGEEESFTNVYNENGLGYCFRTRTISELVGVQKPSERMFQDAMEKNGLTAADKDRIIMVGNNIRKDVAGANRFGITSVLLDWSPRYPMVPACADEQADYIIHEPAGLLELVDRLERRLREGGKLSDLRESDGDSTAGQEENCGTGDGQPETDRSGDGDSTAGPGGSCGTEGDKDSTAGQTENGKTAEVRRKIRLMAKSFQSVLYEEDTTFLENMKARGTAAGDIRRYRFWEWTQGVGMFGFWNYYERYRDREYLDVLEKYYAAQLETGLPAKNVNTVTPLLALSRYADAYHKEEYLQVCDEWAEWIMKDFPRTREGGLQHVTSDSVNQEELWDDTLFMTVLFLAGMGRIRNRQDYIDEAVYQFLLHAKYLADRDTGLWYHGWSFLRRDHFAGAFWARGNCWVTAAIPELISLGVCDPSVSRYLTGILKNQADALAALQEKNGFWHTLLDDPTSYVEASATAGFGYGITRAVNMGLLDDSYMQMADRALDAVLGCITPDGIVTQTSYGTPMGRETKDFYKQIPLRPMPYGQALAILFFLEWLNRSGN